MTARTQDGVKSKSSKKRRHQEDDDEPATNEAKDKKADRKSAKKQAKEDLLSKISTHDSDGIPYSKIQIRRMKRRVKHGLDPIPTEEEEREIAKRKEEEKREVEECLFGDGDKDEKAEDDGSDGEEASVHDDEKDEEQNSEDDVEATQDQHQSTAPPTKKAKRTKPVPKDYICQACQNKPSPNTEFTPHWIYDCPSKVTKRGCNAKSKKLRGLNDPPSRKVFVSGLPFHATEGGVKRFFEKESGTDNMEVVHVKLIKFEDSQRCKGQGILTFDSDQSARAALKMNGCLWEDAEKEGGKSKKKKGKVEKKKEVMELRLKITKVLNRFLTKQKKG